MIPKRFSKRMGLDKPKPIPITVRHDAPGELREFIVALAFDAGFTPSTLRRLVCRVLRVAPNQSNWTEWPNVADEIAELTNGCAWYKVYDIVEEICRSLKSGRYRIKRDEEADPLEYYQEELNDFFVQSGIGWQLVDGLLLVRGQEVFEKIIHTTAAALVETDRATAQHEIHQALSDLSRRPDPDLTGAIQHALAALECVARDVCGDAKATLGGILKCHPDLVPRPLDIALDKVWGYASEYGRHLREGRAPNFDEAELLVGMSAVMATYLARKR